MNVNGIIAEYNPFHNGHKYHLTEAKKQTGADYTIIAMSGNFMQRGAAALTDKYTRVKMALENGADLVLELPICYASSSAEYFATGAVALLDKLGVVNQLCFGSECGDINILKDISNILLEEPAQFSAALRRLLQQGLSYPTARTHALLEYAPGLSCHKDVLSSPNNILGIEYLKALIRRESAIVPFTTKRVGSDYHDKRFGERQCSALAIRQALLSGQEISVLSDQMPESAYKLLKEALLQVPPICSNDFSAFLHYKLLIESDEGYSQYVDVSSDLSDRIRKNLYSFTDFHGFCELLKSKDMTYTRISRCLLHILLDMKKSDLTDYQQLDYVPYARVLGFRKAAAPLLSAIKEHSSIPLITKLADAEAQLTPQAYQMLHRELKQGSIYESVRALKSGVPMRNEFQIPIVLV